jgi:hypothetical protein
MTEPETDIWIVYREYSISPQQWAKRVMAIFSTEPEAIKYMEWLKDNQDAKFGLSWQGWDLDDGWTPPK